MHTVSIYDENNSFLRSNDIFISFIDHDIYFIRFVCIDFTFYEHDVSMKK